MCLGFQREDKRNLRFLGVNPYEKYMEGVLEQRNERCSIVVSDGDSTVKRNVV